MLQNLIFLKRLSLLALLAFFWAPTLSAQLSPDLQLAANHCQGKTFQEENWHPEFRKMPFFWNPLKLVAWTALFAYQKEITYQVHAHCIYTPSCSEYTKSAISRYGLAKGTMMGLDRLSRCNPFDAKKAQKTGLSKGRPADDPTLEAW